MAAPFSSTRKPPYINYYVRDNGVVYRYRQLEFQFSLTDAENSFQRELLRALEKNELDAAISTQCLPHHWENHPGRSPGALEPSLNAAC